MLEAPWPRTILCFLFQNWKHMASMLGQSIDKWLTIFVKGNNLFKLTILHRWEKGLPEIKILNLRGDFIPQRENALPWPRWGMRHQQQKKRTFSMTSSHQHARAWTFLKRTNVSLGIGGGSRITNHESQLLKIKMNHELLRIKTRESWITRERWLKESWIISCIEMNNIWIFEAGETDICRLRCSTITADLLVHFGPFIVSRSFRLTLTLSSIMAERGENCHDTSDTWYCIVGQTHEPY